MVESPTPPGCLTPLPPIHRCIPGLRLGWCKARVIAHNFGVIGSIQLVEAYACDAEFSLREHNLFLWVDFNDLHVKLVADQRVPIGQSDCPAGKRAGIRRVTASRLAGGLILKDNLLGGRNPQDAVIVGIGNQRLSIGQAAGKGCAAELQSIV